MAWRPGRDLERDPEVARALETARQDPELRAWLDRHAAFQEGMKEAWSGIPVPPDLEDRILARAKTVSIPRRRTRAVIVAAAAAVVMLLGLSALWLTVPEEEDSFDTYRSRMVRSVLRQYRMDIETSDMARIREFLSGNDAPADYALAGDVEALPVIGAGVLSWRDRRVSMVCLDGGQEGTVFLFVVDRSAVQDPPPSRPRYERVSRLSTASWSDAERAYVLATHGDEGALQELLR
ncbi:MAG TPA: DUF3379 family protein [Methylomirabilota bacterium]|nr:DUF3379 family protein [Methylomirabilota bacterium]